MAKFMLPIAIFSIFMLCFYYERKEKNRKEHEDWIYNCRQCLVRITHSFRQDCQTVTEKTFATYTSIMLHNSYRDMPDYMIFSFLSDYRRSIDELKEDYIENISVKANEAMEHYAFTDIPNYLVEEYNKQVLDIYNSFYDFSYLMQAQIAEANETHITMLLEGS